MINELAIYGQPEKLAMMEGRDLIVVVTPVSSKPQQESKPGINENNVS